MGWCHEFGVEVEPHCSHPMVAGPSSCSCPECATVCPGRFEGGCEAVWARGPRPSAPARASGDVSVARFQTPTNGAVPSAVTGAGPVQADPAERTKQLQAALAHLAEEVARQAQRQATLEHHLAELGKVLGQLGLEVDERLGLVERILDKMIAPTEQLGP